MMLKIQHNHSIISGLGTDVAIGPDLSNQVIQLHYNKQLTTIKRKKKQCQFNLLL